MTKGNKEPRETIPQARMTEVKNSLARACGQVDPTTSWWGQCCKVAAEIIKATPTVTGEEVLARANRCQRRWPGFPITLQVLVNHWGTLGPAAEEAPRRVSKFEVEELERIIDYHPANPDSITNNPEKTTDDQRAELRGFRARLLELRLTQP